MTVASYPALSLDLIPIDDNMVQGPPCHPGGIHGLGNVKHGVMVIGVAPGKDEMRTGRPLTGNTGQLFNDILAAIGFPREQVYVTNMCCTYVPGKIKREHMQHCWSRMEREIRAVQPRLIITLGTEVCQFWTGKTIKQARGAALYSRRYQCYVMPMIQPAALFHDGSTSNTESDRASNTAYDIVRDLRKIKEILRWPIDGSRSNVEYTTITSQQQAQQILNELPTDGRPVSLDVETNAKIIDLIDIRRDALICLAISDGTDTWVGEAEHFRGCVWPTDSINWTFHNSLFDTSIIFREYGVWLPIGEDTMLMSYTCDERPGYHALKPLAREYEGCGFYEDNRAKSLSELMAYNAKDAAYTARLARGKLASWQREEGTQDVYRRLLIPAANVMKETMSRGARVDVQLLQQLEQEWGDERDENNQKVQQLAYEAGWPDDNINLNAWQQVGKMLYGVLGLEDPCGRCQKAMPSTDKDHLKLLSGAHPFVDALNDHREMVHNYGIYIDGWVKHIRIHGTNHGRIHSRPKLHGTATGRRSYADPAVQTIPRPSNKADKYGKLRQVIIPTDDSYEIAYADYTRAEIYTAYGYSRDPVMWEALQKDYHFETAVNVMHKSRERMLADPDYKEEMRRIAKIVTFGIFYGMEPFTLSQTAEISYAEAANYIYNFFKSNARYNTWYKETLAELERTGEVTSLTGRKRRFVMIQSNPRVLKQAVNFPIQSTAGDVTLQAFIKLHYLLKELDCHILFDVHDAIVFEIAKRNRYQALKLIKETMEAIPFPDIDPTFPAIPTDQYIGSSWGHAKKITNLEELRAA